MKKVSRNEPCPCGSGNKYKNCHGKRPNQTVVTITIFGVALIGGGLLLNYYATNATTAPASVSQVPGQSVPQPSGDAPPGKVWSPEHGHWHDAPAATSAPAAPPADTPHATQQAGGIPQPDGPVPEGKVWSPEHGHWHDATQPAQPFTPPPPGTTVPQPEGPVPAGKIWNADHGHWHDWTPPAPETPVKKKD